MSELELSDFYKKEQNERATKTDEVGQIDGLSLQEEQGINLGGRKAVEIANLLRGSEKEGKRTTKEIAVEQEKKLVQFAEREGYWDLSKYGNHIRPLLDDNKKGAESDVYLLNSDEGKKVIKVTNWDICNHTPYRFIVNKIALHNTLFPQVAYKLIGFCHNDDGFCYVLEQPYIQNEVDATQEEIDKDIRKRGFIKKNYSYTTEDYVVSDLAPWNVLKGLDGELYYIDPIIHLNEKGGKYDGNRTYK